MHRKLGSVHFHPFDWCHSKLHHHHVHVRRIIGIAIVIAGWTFFFTDWLDNTPQSSVSNLPVIEQMLGNPSPK